MRSLIIQGECSASAMWLVSGHIPLSDGYVILVFSILYLLILPDNDICCLPFYQ